MKTNPITFWADSFEIQAAIVQIHLVDRLPMSRITITRIRAVLTDWYETHGLALPGMSADEYMDVDPPEDDSPLWGKAHARAITLGIVQKGAA